MEKFINPEMKIISMETDVIATSNEGIGEGDGDAAAPSRSFFDDVE